jgi:hypothetical protein
MKLEAVTETLNGISDTGLQGVFRSWIKLIEWVTDARGDNLTELISSCFLSFQIDSLMASLVIYWAPDKRKGPRDRQMISELSSSIPVIL